MFFVMDFMMKRITQNPSNEYGAVGKSIGLSHNHISP